MPDARVETSRHITMSIEGEVSLKIPRVTVPAGDQDHKVIDNSAVRFTKLIHVPRIPKPGSLQLTTRCGEPFACSVTRAEWHEQNARFILSCSYAKRSMTAEQYDALNHDADWHMRPLGVG
jgi:hypothetical protein